MLQARSKITSQGQVSVPASVRASLGVMPGSELEWHDDGGKIVVKRAAKLSFEELRAKVFPKGPPTPITPEEMKRAVEQHLLEKHGYSNLKPAKATGKTTRGSR
jgi:antitoxin PrlF